MSPCSACHDIGTVLRYTDGTTALLTEAEYVRLPERERAQWWSVETPCECAGWCDECGTKPCQCPATGEEAA